MNNDFPRGWRKARVGDVANRVVVGYVGPSRLHYDSNGIPFLMGKNIRASRLLLDDLERVTREFHDREKKSQLWPNDVVVVRIGRSGTAVVIPQELGPANCGGLVIVKQPKAALPRYLAHYLNSPEGQQASLGEARGVTRQTLNTRSVEASLLPLAPLNEQRRIVAKLDKLLSRVDAAQARLATVPRILKRFRQSVLAAACSGRLTLDWRQDNPQTPLKNGHVPAGAPDVPGSWHWRTLSAISQVKGGVTKGRKLSGRKTIWLPYLRVANVQDGYLDLSQIKQIEVLPEDKEKYALKAADLLFTEGGDRDKLGRGTVWRNEVANCIHQNHIFRARIVVTDVDADYVSIASKSDFSREYFFSNSSQTVNLASINLTMLSGLPVPLPPLAEQQEIVHRVEALFKTADVLEARYRKAKAHIDKLTQSILAKAFRGELVPQDPNDEPASVLLERIREQRNGAPIRKTPRKNQRSRE